MPDMDCMNDKFVKGRLLNRRYVTVAPLNHGSFGMVFLATDMKTKQDVAIKCLGKTSNEVSVVDEHFEELECHRLLSYHQNLVNLVDSFETKSHIYLVLEYCANGDLYEAIRLNRGPLETEHVRDFMLQLIDAVEFMHINRMYHRDVKPENIFLTHDGSMKLGDFGLATRDPWCYDACVGSDRYMAPEQYDPAPTGYSPAKADVWAVGICLLNVLFARNPFVSPTESDILFADYVRDRQSLFDIFPNMSQDTFEILRVALAIDPEKRSLSGVREAISRTVSFTTDDEALDEFCTDDREVVPPATANRQPLRTPSIQSPHNQGDSFPWAKALQSSPPQAIRQLSAIPDSESCSEDLFPASETAGTSWFSGHFETPSMASVLDSALGESYRSSPLRKRSAACPPPSDPVPITGSLPSHASKPLPSLSMVFGRKSDNQISKSWSDLWDEEESEGDDSMFQQRRDQNSRSWSQESPGAVNSGPLTELCGPGSSSRLNSRSPNKVLANKSNDKALDSDGDTSASDTPRALPLSSSQKPRVDKWAALGDKRRNYKPREVSFSANKRLNSLNWRKDWGLGSSGFDYGSWAIKDPQSRQDRRRRSLLDKNWRRDSENSKPLTGKLSSSYDGSVDEDLDLVGGWHDLHL